MAFLVATTSLPAVYRPNDDPLRRPLERRTLMLIVKIAVHYCHASQPPERRPTGTPTAFAKRICGGQLGGSIG